MQDSPHFSFEIKSNLPEYVVKSDALHIHSNSLITVTSGNKSTLTPTSGLNFES